MQFLDKEKISEEELEKVVEDIQLAKLDIPTNVSVENTLSELNQLTQRLYELHNKQPRDPTPLNKIIGLLELKIKIVGMINVKPEMQSMIDSEINTYKRKFIELAALCVDSVTMGVLTEKLAKEGL